ncbi:MAG: hypothetical protein KDB53_19280, partial [Planctomycetes bacterium]|nr:hypothetical protein [Planctomycetota bacterium]
RAYSGCTSLNTTTLECGAFGDVERGLAPGTYPLTLLGSNGKRWRQLVTISAHQRTQIELRAADFDEPKGCRFPFVDGHSGQVFVR